MGLCLTSKGGHCRVSVFTMAACLGILCLPKIIQCMFALNAFTPLVRPLLASLLSHQVPPKYLSLHIPSISKLILLKLNLVDIHCFPSSHVSLQHRPISSSSYQDPSTSAKSPSQKSGLTLYSCLSCLHYSVTDPVHLTIP